MKILKLKGWILVAVAQVMGGSGFAETQDSLTWGDEVYGPIPEGDVTPEGKRDEEPFEYRFPEEKSSLPAESVILSEPLGEKSASSLPHHFYFGVESGFLNHVPFQFRHLSYGESSTGEATNYQTERGSLLPEKNLGVSGAFVFEDGFHYRLNYRFEQLVTKTSFNEGAGSFYGQVDNQSQAMIHRLGGLFGWAYAFSGSWKSLVELGMELDWSKVTERETAIEFTDGSRRSRKLIDSQLLTLSPVFGARLAYDFQSWRLTGGPEVVLPILELQKKATGDLSSSLLNRQFNHEGTIGWEFVVSAAFAL